MLFVACAACSETFEVWQGEVPRGCAARIRLEVRVIICAIAAHLIRFLIYWENVFDSGTGPS
eukprot:2307786-Pyramimonas_sp.AAC.1